MSRRAVVLKHVEIEGPARVGELLSDLGYAVEVRSTFRGDPVPAALDQGDVLVVMGGPMGVADRNAPETAYLQREIDLLQRQIARDAPVLGVCLGAQLLAHAAGADVKQMRTAAGERVYEVGWGTITLDRAAGDEILAGVPPEIVVLHWHGDTFEIPAGARRFASSPVCPNQGFRLGRHGFGLQFHCEVGRGDVDAFLRANANYVAQANGPDGVARIAADTEQLFVESRHVGDVLLRNILRAMTTD
ncbi:gamma-glutamyl-gamma-aminobutyrate hydrolase family protein [Candidatus Binatia bacterium]|nr:gamma-glutamyl-gamma-aminobutyrate hydrolase family protein [Candidatus Binatia bacterium]